MNFQNESLFLRRRNSRRTRLFESSQVETSILIALGDISTTVDHFMRMMKDIGGLPYEVEAIVESLLSAQDIADDIISGKEDIQSVLDVLDEIGYAYKLSKGRDFKSQISVMGRSGKGVQAAAGRIFETAKNLKSLARGI